MNITFITFRHYLENDKYISKIGIRFILFVFIKGNKAVFVVFNSFESHVILQFNDMKLRKNV